MKRILLAALLAFSTSALADDRTDEQKAADAWLSILSESYTFLRIGSDNCGLPTSEWLSARSRILVAALEYPRIDILKIERDLDRLYEDEKRRWVTFDLDQRLDDRLGPKSIGVLAAEDGPQVLKEHFGFTFVIIA